MKTKAILLILLLPVLIGVAFYVGNRQGFATGSRQGFSTGHNAGHDVGYANAKKDFALQIESFGKADPYTQRLETDYNKLVSDYNTLLKYANTPKYAPRQSISCTSYDYGTYSNFTSTNCY